ncbi:MAG TPA: O-antigen ligase family protein [Gemmatimonadales bacterium]
MNPSSAYIAADFSPSSAPRAAVAPATAVPSVRVNAVVRAGLWLYILSIPFEIPHRTFPIEVTTATGLIFLLTTLLNPRACYRRIPAPLLWFAGHLWILAIAAIFNGVEEIDSVVKHFVSLAQLLLLFWTMSNVLEDPRALRGFLIAMVIACVVRAGIQILGIGATSHEVWTGGERITALGQNANLSAMILAAGIITVVGLYAAHSSWLPRFGVFTWGIALLMGWATIQTGSRGGLICIAVGLACYLFSGTTLKARVRNACLGIAGMAILGIGAMHSSMMRARLEAAAQQGNLAGREKIYPAVISMIRERPILGWGPVENQFEIGRRIGERKKASRDAHDLVFELVTTSGIIGAVPFLIGLGLCIAAAWKSRHGAMGYLPVAFMATILFGCIDGTWLASKILWITLALAIAAARRWSNPATRTIWSVDPCAG